MEPDTVSVNPGPPTTAEAGETPDKVGTGFGVMLIVKALETKGLELLTVTESEPTFVRVAAGRVANK